MSVRPILIYGDARLAMTADPVGAVTGAVRELAADMVATMYAAPGRGLAAPQIGVCKRLFVMDCGWKDGSARDPLVAIDPELSDPSGEMAEMEEGCLSIPGILVRLARPAAITMAWTGLDGSRFMRRLTGIEAVCVQHEFDHLDGVLIVDRMPPQDRTSVAGELEALASGALPGPDAGQGR